MFSYYVLYIAKVVFFPEIPNIRYGYFYILTQKHRIIRKSEQFMTTFRYGRLTLSLINNE